MPGEEYRALKERNGENAIGVDAKSLMTDWLDELTKQPMFISNYTFSNYMNKVKSQMDLGIKTGEHDILYLFLWKIKHPLI